MAYLSSCFTWSIGSGWAQNLSWSCCFHSLGMLSLLLGQPAEDDSLLGDGRTGEVGIIMTSGDGGTLTDMEASDDGDVELLLPPPTPPDNGRRC